jgi:prepilin-type N-terminal cleavage/methylation domain-containing protein
MKSERGFTLLEVVVAIGIFSILVATYFTAQSTAFKSSYLFNTRVKTIYLSQTENISSAEVYPGIIGYVHMATYNNAPWWYTANTSSVNMSPGLSFAPSQLLPKYAGLTVNVTASSLAGIGSYSANETKIQKITVKISQSRPWGAIDILQIVGYNAFTGGR